MNKEEQNIRVLFEKGGLYLFPKYFNENSEIKLQTYLNNNGDRKSWVEILKLYDKYEIMLDTLVKLYKKFIEESGSQNLHNFIKEYRYFSYDFLVSIGVDIIREKAGIKKKRYSDEEYVSNFMNLYKKYDRIPTYNEFDDNSLISINSYANHYKLEGTVYDEIVRYYIKDKEVLDEYFNNKISYRSDLGKLTGYQKGEYIVSDQQMEEEFKSKFQSYVDTYGIAPSTNTFKKIIKYDLKSYYKRYNVKWSGLCVKYGFPAPKIKYRSEVSVLNLVSKLINSHYEPQKTWDWLIGIGGRNMFCDGYFPEYSLVVEFDGEQHRRPISAFGGAKTFERTKQNDALKDKLLKEHGINIVRIDSRINWHKERIIYDLLKKNGVVNKAV